MPELPEVHTTVEGIKKTVLNKTVVDTWSDYYIKTKHGNRQTLKNESYFLNFRKLVKGAKIISADRGGKNILINLDNGRTIVIHMKMTGHLMYGDYEFVRDRWQAKEKGPLQDPFNQYIHFVLYLSNNKQLVLSDMRKFGSVTITKTSELHLHESVGVLGPNPLDKNFTWKELFKKIHNKGNLPIKSALLDQSAIAGIGNIYSDEILSDTSIHPLSPASAIPEEKFKEIYKSMIKILEFSIKHGGDSKSDYRNIHGEKGGFQNFHKVYGKRKEKCAKRNCHGIIERIVVKGRSSHFCPIHQILYKNK